MLVYFSIFEWHSAVTFILKKGHCYYMDNMTSIKSNIKEMLNFH